MTHNQRLLNQLPNSARVHATALLRMWEDGTLTAKQADALHGLFPSPEEPYERVRLENHTMIKSRYTCNGNTVFCERERFGNCAWCEARDVMEPERRKELDREAANRVE